MDTSNLQQLGAANAAQDAKWKAEPPQEYCATDLSTVAVSRMKQEPNQLQQAARSVVQSVVKPKKKRIRQQKLELEYLRGLVAQLEGKIATLKATALRDGAKAPTRVQVPLVWKGIAERQQKERSRAEEKNQKLRISVEGQLKLAMKLQGLLRKRPRDEEVDALADGKRFKALANSTVSPTDDEVFADQLEHVRRAHLEVDRLFGGEDFTDLTASFCDLDVLNDPGSDSGIAFVKKASSMLPFDVQVTEKAFWRMLAEEGTKKDSYFFEERLTTESIAARAYGLYFNASPTHANVRGKQTFRKDVRDSFVTIMWKWVVEPVEINGTKFRGVKCHETGWIVLRGVNMGNPSTPPAYGSLLQNVASRSTLLQSYSKMTMELQEDIVDQDLQVGTLTDFVVNLHDTITDVCAKMITNVLVEEDWNLNGWIGA